MVLRANKSINVDEINSTLNKFIDEHDSKINNLFKTEKNEQLKNAASILLKLSAEERPKMDYILWAENIFHERIPEIENKVKSLIDIYTSFIGELTLAITHFDDNYNFVMKEWMGNVESHRLVFHKDLQEVLKSHFEYGPVFLFHLEREAREAGINTKSVSWDPARMVGWKLLAAGVEMEAIDITSFLKELIPGFAHDLYGDGYDENALVTGSLFTDYVHYISKSDPRQSARNITKELLQRLLRPGQIKNIMKSYRSSVYLSSRSHPEQVENLLVEFGWPPERSQNEIKLADCIQEDNGIRSINPILGGNEIRCVVESYCKDLIDTLASITGHTEEELWNIVLLKHPDYMTRNKGWNYEIGHITIGSAIFILSALLNDAFPDKKDSSEALIKNLVNLNRKLNPMSHHPPIEINAVDLLNEINNIMGLTKVLVTEMPWHFYPVQRNGQQPVVLTGNAWSHSYKQNRQLSIIIWTRENYSEQLLVWNPSRTNPVIPDGIIIRRPSR